MQRGRGRAMRAFAVSVHYCGQRSNGSMHISGELDGWRSNKGRRLSAIFGARVSVEYCPGQDLFVSCSLFFFLFVACYLLVYV